jgi:hypothetical protein
MIFSFLFYFFIAGEYIEFDSDFITVSSNSSFRGVITTLIRSNNESVLLVINMIHSVIRFHSTNNNYKYPFIIFHDQNFTLTMRQQILSCVLKNHTQVDISFALVDFQTSVKPAGRSQLNKPIGYRLMCRFWTYDIFYHSAIIQGQYDYLMRMDADSYFSDATKKDLFLYMKRKELDYMYRSKYWEPSTPMDSILELFSIKSRWFRLDCIYNNFFIIRLKWYYENELVQDFVHELIRDDLMLREYIGDGCAHAAMLKIDSRIRVKFMKDFSYGHNFHVMPTRSEGITFIEKSRFLEEIKESCRQLTVLRGTEGILTLINVSHT